MISNPNKTLLPWQTKQPLAQQKNFFFHQGFSQKEPAKFKAA